jgi:transcriptional regulator with XRE-family HTH domain
MSTLVSPAVLAERLRGLREAKRLLPEDVAQRSGVPVHTYRRYERGENEKIPFDHVVALGKFYGLTPNEMAALAGIWVLQDQSTGVRTIDRFLELMGTFLRELSSKRADVNIEFFTTLMEVERLQQGQRDEEGTVSLLPEWVRGKINEDNSL